MSRSWSTAPTKRERRRENWGTGNTIRRRGARRFTTRDARTDLVRRSIRVAERRADGGWRRWWRETGLRMWRSGRG